jgi:DNA-binding transcriptional MerR regulator
MTKEGSSTYFAEYYAENKEIISARRRQRYAEDPEYRERCKAQSREAKKRLAERRRKERAKNKDKDSGKPTWYKILYDGREIPVKMFSTGQLAKKLGRKAQTMRIWERKGIIPESMYRTASQDRLYTAFQVRLIVTAYRRGVRRFGAEKMRTRISSTNFIELVQKIWDRYPLGIDEDKL